MLRSELSTGQRLRFTRGSRDSERYKRKSPLNHFVGAGVGVDLLVYTPEEFARMQAEERPFLVDALADARQVYVGREGGS